MFDVYVFEDALCKAEEHFSRAAQQGLEALGLFAGDAFVFEGKAYVVLEDYLTADNEATSVSVRFSREAFAQLASSLPQGRLLVAWAHSHPSYGCFLSATDLRTQQAFFNEVYHVALVVDPLRGERKFFKIDGAGYKEASYAVIRRRS